MEVRKLSKFNQFCLFYCWKSDDLNIFGRLPVRAYCPGQTMNLKLDVINKSGREVLYFLVHFIQVRSIYKIGWWREVERKKKQKGRDGCQNFRQIFLSHK